MLTQLLSRFKKDKAAEVEADEQPAKPARRPISAPPFLLPGLLAGLVGLVAIGGAGLLTYSERAGREAQTDEVLVQERARAAANRMHGYVATLAGTVERLAAEPAMVAAVQARDPAAVTAEAAAVGAVMPGFEGARVVYPEQKEPDFAAQPPLGYAALDLARRVEQGQQPPVEVHVVAGDRRQIAVARPVKAEDTMVGTLLVAFDAAPLAKWMGPAPEQSRVELVQTGDGGRLLLAAAGGVSGTPRESTAAVAGSRWQVKVGAPQTQTVPLVDALLPFAAFWLVQFLVVVVLFVMLGRLVRDDLVRLVRQFIQLYNGQPAYGTGLRLSEFRRAYKALEQYLQLHHGVSPSSGQSTPAYFAAPRFGDDPSVPDAMFLDRSDPLAEEPGTRATPPADRSG